MSGILQYLFFYGWLIVSQIASRFPRCSMCPLSFYLRLRMLHGVDETTFCLSVHTSYISDDRHQSYSHLFAIMINAVNIGVQFSVPVPGFNSFSCIPSSGVAESHGRLCLIFGLSLKFELHQKRLLCLPWVLSPCWAAAQLQSPEKPSG
jgi:hypothetical protein